MKKTILFILVCIGLPCGIYAQVGTYYLNGNANDASPNANHGSLESYTFRPPGKNVPMAVKGHSGTDSAALSFPGSVSDGNAYVKIPKSSSTEFDSTKSFAISIWFKYTGTPFTPTLVTNVIAPYGAGYQLGLNNTSGKIRPRFNMGKGGSRADMLDVLIDSILTKDTWYNWVVNVDQSNKTLEMYLNGVKMNLVKNPGGSAGTAGTVSGKTASYSGTGITASSGGDIQLGLTKNFVTTHFLNGSLDNLFIFDRLLTPTEITNLQSDQLPGGGGTTSLEEEYFQTGWNMYPNPAQNKLEIDVVGNAVSSLRVFDLTGKIKATYTLYPGNNQINISDLESGLYLVEMSGLVKRLIIE